MPVWTNMPGAERFDAWRGRVSSFPAWGTPILLLSAVPGVVIALLSIVLLVASLLALLLLTLPVYRLITWVASLGRPAAQSTAGTGVGSPTFMSPGAKPVEVRILD